MSFEVLKMIVLLCQLNTGADATYSSLERLDRQQVKCQTFYIDCLYEEAGQKINETAVIIKDIGPIHFRKCIQKRLKAITP